MKVSHLARAIHSSRSQHKFMLGLSAYFDESGDADDPECHFVGMAGLIAPSEAWEKFDGKWQAILDEHCGGKPFHAKDFAYQSEPFKGWDKGKREKFLCDLVRTIQESGSRPFGAVVSLDAYKTICQGIPHIKKAVIDPYYICFQDVTRAAAVSLIGYGIDHMNDVKRWEQFENTEKVAMVYPHQTRLGAISSKPGTAPQSMGRAESLWYAIKGGNPQFGRWMGSYASGSPNELTFLQAADLIAYELTHEYENRMKRPKDDMRWGLAQILPGDWPVFLHKVYGVPQLLEMFIESGVLGPHDDSRHEISIGSSMDSIANRDLLFGRVRKRRNKK
jgi:hypothetical protein